MGDHRHEPRAVVDDTAVRRGAGTADTLDAILRAAPLAMVSLSGEGRVEIWNPGAEALFGWSAEEVVGHPVPFVPPEHREEYDALWSRVMAGETVSKLERVRRRKGGALVDVRLSVAPLRWPDGSVRGVVGMFEDVSAERAAERSRRRSEGRLRFMAEVGQVLASSLDPERTLRQLARLAVPRIADGCAIFLAEADGIRLVEMAHRNPAVLEAARQVVERYPPTAEGRLGATAVLHTGEPELLSEVTPEMIRAAAEDPEHLRLLLSLGIRSMLTAPLVARGGPIGVITLANTESRCPFTPADLEFAWELGTRAGLAVDNARLFREASRRADEEAALRQATVAVARSDTTEAVIQAIAESALLAVGADGAFVERITSDADAVEVVATRGAHTPGEGVRALLHGSLAERTLQRRAPIRVDDVTGVGNLLPPDPGRRSGALALPLQDGGGPIGVLILVRRNGVFDGADEDRAVTFANLATLAFRRMHLLQETEARREELERVTESRARLVRGFGHDLKNPLGAADGHLELLEEGLLGPLTPRQRDSIRRSRSAIRASLDLIHDLVELARAEAAWIQVERLPVDLAATVGEVVEEHRAAAERKGLRLSTEFPPQVSIIASDPSRIRQVLGNLLSNAVKYTDRGEIRVLLEEVRGKGDQACFAVRVIDSGRGIPASKRHLLFREFARISTEGEGMGLGLAISLRLARALGGDVTAESEVGRGSTFTLWLPAEPPRAERVA